MDDFEEFKEGDSILQHLIGMNNTINIKISELIISWSGSWNS